MLRGMNERGVQPATSSPALSTRALDNLPATRRKLLEYLKREDGATSDAIAAALGITASAARQHLSALTTDGLIQFERERIGPGRPTHRYSLTTAGDALFPRNYVDLTNELLGYVEDNGELLARIFDKRGLARLARARGRVEGLAFGDKVAVVARILDEDGTWPISPNCRTAPTA